MRQSLRWMTGVATALLIASPVLSAQPPGKHKGQSLPPGLQKKVQRGGELPPGWQDKLQVGSRLDRDLYDRHGVILRPAGTNGIMEVQIENEVLRVMDNTLEIIDILTR